MKPMTLFSIVFAAILAAAAVIMTGIYAKARLDDWEKAKWMIIAEMQNNNAASQAISDRYMAEARQRALLIHDYNDVAIVNQLTGAAVSESQESLKRLRQIQAKAVALLENKPFGIPLTADEQAGLDSLKAEIAKSANPTPTPVPTATPLPGFESDESMKPTTEASEAEHQRRRTAQQRETQETYPHAKPVLPSEMVTTPTPTPHL